MVNQEIAIIICPLLEMNKPKKCKIMLSKHKQKASINATNRIHLHDSKIYQAKTLKVKVYGDCFDRVSAGRNP